jgi:hypothetical protein
MNDKKHPCNCPPLEAPSLTGASLPQPGAISQALAAISMTPAINITKAVGSSSLSTPLASTGDALLLAAGGGPPSLDTLLALAKANPGLKITLSY